MPFLTLHAALYATLVAIVIITVRASVVLQSIDLEPGDNEWMRCSEIVLELRDHFSELLLAEGQFQPLNLTMVEENLQSHACSNIKSFADDINLLFDNALKHYPFSKDTQNMLLIGKAKFSELLADFVNQLLREAACKSLVECSVVSEVKAVYLSSTRLQFQCQKTADDYEENDNVFLPRDHYVSVVDLKKRKTKKGKVFDLAQLLDDIIVWKAFGKRHI